MKPANFDNDLQLEYQFAKTIKGILGNYFIVKDKMEDLENGTDFLLFFVKPFRVGVRLRRFTFYCRYPDEFTIRWKRPSGVKTEIHKIKEGLVDYLFYGFVNENGTRLQKYFIGDLNIFRMFFIKPRAIIPNNPLDSWLAVWKINDFPPEFILRTWEKYEN